MLDSLSANWILSLILSLIVSLDSVAGFSLCIRSPDSLRIHSSILSLYSLAGFAPDSLLYSLAGFARWILSLDLLRFCSRFFSPILSPIVAEFLARFALFSPDSLAGFTRGIRSPDSLRIRSSFLFLYSLASFPPDSLFHSLAEFARRILSLNLLGICSRVVSPDSLVGFARRIRS